MPPRHFEAIIFSATAATAAVFAMMYYVFFNLPGARSGRQFPSFL
jgi:hypothetical protein